MKQPLWTLLAFLIIGFTTLLKANDMSENLLTPKHQSIITIAAFSASGELEKLKPALHQGLDAGLNINELKEILVQLYAYTGFPRSLNALATLKSVLEERQTQGIKDNVGKEASPLPANFNKDDYGARVRANLIGQKDIPAPSGYQLFAPVIDTFLKEHLFADIFARDILDYQTRELVTISALASMKGTAPQLQSHLAICLNVGWKKEQLEAFVALLEKRVGTQEAKTAKEVLTAVLVK